MDDSGNGYNFNDDAVWKSLQVSYSDYLAATPAEFRSPWCKHPSWSLQRHRDDLLHLMYLGIVKDVAGQILHELATRPGAGNMDAELKTLWLETTRVTV
jgi:hypothetical protein